MRKPILVLAFLLAAGIDASAQEFTGSIYGRIVDPTNAVMPGVSITVEGDAIQGPRTTESEANGSYRFPYLPPGEYRVTYQKATFKKIVYNAALVEVDKTTTMNVTMQVADVEATLVVTGGSPIVDVKNATVGTNFGESMLRDIPNTRDLMSLLAETPGISMPRTDVGGNTAGTQTSYQAYGLSGQSITTVDGVNITTGSDALGAFIDYGAIAEAKIAGAGNSADVAVAGAAVTTLIKSGSNTQHGEVYADFKPDGGKKQYEGAEHFWRYRDINGQISGPFVKDRLWYFTSFRQQAATLLTGMYDKKGGTRGQPFNTDTTDYTIKLTHQLSRSGTLTFMTQWGRKYQPFRGGSGVTAYQYLAESTGLQDSWSEIGKVDYMRVINNRAMLDASVNFFGSQFPLKAQTDKTPINDDVTFLRTGAYSLPSFSQDQRWHYNATLNLYATNHDMKIGYMYQWYAPRFTNRGAPGPEGTVGHFFITTTNGVPSSFSTDNGPVWNRNVLGNNAVFFQDKFQVTPRLTLNYGIRFDQYHSSYPEQRFGLNGNKPCADDNDCDFGPFVVKTVTPARGVVTFNNVVPRVALIYDLFGNSKTALKASWGRYSTNPAAGLSALVNPIDLITKKYAWDSDYLTTDPAVAATRITPAYVATLQSIRGGAQLTPSAVDPKLTNSYTDEYTFGAEQEIASDLRGYVTVVRKRQKNMWDRYDRLRTASAYVPVQAVDPGPDGAIKSDDDRIITVWEARVNPDTTDYYVTNKPIGDRLRQRRIRRYQTNERQLAAAQRFHLDETASVVVVFRGSQRRGLELEQHTDDGLDVQGVGKLPFRQTRDGRLGLQSQQRPALRALLDCHRAAPESGGSEADDAARSREPGDRGGEGRDVLLAKHQRARPPGTEGIRLQAHTAASADVEPVQLLRLQDHDRRRPGDRRLQPADEPPQRNRRPLQHALHILTMRTLLRSSSFGGQAVCTTAVLLLLSALLCAQVRVGVLLINVVVTVVDEKGRTVPNLTIDDFIVEEDGQPQTIKHLTPTANLPTSIGIIIDVSGSMRSKIRTAQRAVDRFFSLIYNDDEIFLMTFAMQASLIADFTTHRAKLTNALLTGVNVGGGTALYDSLYQALQKVKEGRYERKAVPARHRRRRHHEPDALRQGSGQHPRSRNAGLQRRDQGNAGIRHGNRSTVRKHTEPHHRRYEGAEPVRRSERRQGMGDLRGRIRQEYERGARHDCGGAPQPIQHWLLPEPSGERRQVAQRPNPHEESRLRCSRPQGIPRQVTIRRLLLVRRVALPNEGHGSFPSGARSWTRQLRTATLSHSASRQARVRAANRES